MENKKRPGAGRWAVRTVKTSGGMEKLQYFFVPTARRKRRKQKHARQWVTDRRARGRRKA